MYDFRKLSPADFEELTRDLLQEEWGVRLEAFKTGRDGGIDLRYSEIPGASTIIQCKHYVGSTIQRLVSDLKRKERPKIERLAPSRYVLVTSLPLNPADKDKILANLHPFIKTTHDIFGGDDLNNLLGRHGCVEEHHFKLWMSSTTVMQHVLHNATLGSACDVTTYPHSTRVEDALAEIRNRPEEEAEQPIKSWQREEQAAPQIIEEAEVRRLFDGLR